MREPPSRSCWNRAARRRRQCPKAAQFPRGRSGAKSIDDDEHSGILERVMANTRRATMMCDTSESTT
jgi:hypothetical protein